ncbi:MAG: hypothetical protein M1815_000947 [Lichina confinis]|nr:MAG: hypothetical protein M1815_000947 [Lichina confinis]
MRAVFLGEGKAARNGSVVMGTNWRGDTARSSHGVHEESSSSGLRQAKGKFSVVQHWLEVWDYIGGARFRSFVVDHDAGGEREMFVFFEGSAIVADLRPGVMALIELASSPHFGCSSLIVCVDRVLSPSQTQSLVRDLGWVGFSAITLKDWSNGMEMVSPRWLFLTLEV